MSRYLTPTKICLLVLIQIYNSDDIPRGDRLAAASFIASHINPSSESSQEDLDSQVRAFTLDITTFSLTLSKRPSRMPGRSIYHVFLQRLWALSDLDRLFTFFEEIDKLLVPISPHSPEEAAKWISRASPFGQFIRRCCVEFTRLQFTDSQKLWASLYSYLTPSYAEYSQRYPSSGAELAPSQSFTQEPGPGPSSFIGADDTSNLLAQSIQHLQRLGTRVSANLKAHLSTWLGSLHDSGSQSLQHFLAFFEYWRAGVYNMALESLHRYFDYSLATQQDSNGANVSGGGMKMYYQYALLHLSVLQADFERWEQSLEALGECIATARENQDSACLNFALSYLLYLRQAHPQSLHMSFSNLTKLIGGCNGTGESEISFLKTKAREGRHWSLLAGTLLEESRAEMQTGGNLSKALECILQSEYLCAQHDLRTMMPAAALFNAASLDRLGQNTIGSHVHEGISVVHGHHSPLGDGVRASCRIAHNLALSGRFEKALEVLRAAKDGTAKGVLKLEQRVLICEMLVLLRRSIHSEEFDDGDYYLEQVRPARSFAESDATFEVTVLEVQLLLKKHDYHTALQIVNKSIQDLKQGHRSDIAHRIRLLVLKAQIFDCASQPTKGLSIALRAAATAERHLLMSVFIEAVAVLAPILLALGEFAAARDIVGAALPHALEASDMYVVARLFALLAEAILGFAGKEEEVGSVARVNSVKAAGGYVERSLEAYSRIWDLSGQLDCLALKAKLARWNSDEAIAAQADEQYDQLLSDHAERRRVGS